MEIIMVKKIFEDGSECKKCSEVSERLKENDELKYIDKFAYADVRDSSSEGFKLAEKHGVDVAPFFIVIEDGKETIYKTYLQLRKNAFQKESSKEDEEIENKRNRPPEDPEEDMYWM